MTVKLIVTDLDGTLLNDRQIVSKANIAAFHTACENGIATSIATGRMHFAAAFFGRMIGANAPVISCNGAMIRTTDTNEAIYEEYIDDDVTEELLTLFAANDLYYSWYSGTKRFAPYFSWEMFPLFHTVENFSLTETGEDHKPYTKNTSQIIIRHQEKIPLKLVQFLEEKYKDIIRLQQNTGYTIDITPPHVNKATGLKKLADFLGIKKENILAIGDSDNDIEMLKYAGISAATANGLDPAKKAASFITDDCNNDGVAKAIYKVLKQEHNITN